MHCFTPFQKYNYTASGKPYLMITFSVVSVILYIWQQMYVNKHSTCTAIGWVIISCFYCARKIQCNGMYLRKGEYVMFSTREKTERGLCDIT